MHILVGLDRVVEYHHRARLDVAQDLVQTLLGRDIAVVVLAQHIPHYQSVARSECLHLCACDTAVGWSIEVAVDKLVGEINKAMAELKKNGEFDKIYKTWFGEVKK